MTIFNTKNVSIQPTVGNAQGADFVFFGDKSIEGVVLENMIRSLFTRTDHAVSGLTLTISLFVPGYGYHHLSLVTSASICSMALPIASEGLQLIIDGHDMGANAHVFLEAYPGSEALAGASLMFIAGSGVSLVDLTPSAWLKLVCVNDGDWSIVEYNAAVAFTASS